MIGFWRLLIGASVLAVTAVALHAPWPSRWRTVVGAGLAFGVHQIAVILATKGTTIAVVTLIAALQPLLVALLSRRAVGERVPVPLRWCAVLALAGPLLTSVAVGDRPRRSGSPGLQLSSA